MQRPKTFSLVINGVPHAVAFSDFDVMTDDTFDSPLVTASIDLKPTGGEAISLEYEEWADELVDGVDSRWETGCSEQWNAALPDMDSDDVNVLRHAVDTAIYRRLRGSFWRVHL